MDWLIGNLGFLALVAVLVWVGRRIFARYRRCTYGDSNAPSGFVTDWDEFFGRKRRK